MANEAKLLFETQPAIPFIVADGTAIPKGTLCKLTDGMTAIITSGAGDMIAGVAISEKIADDGKTKLGIYRGGVFRFKISGTVGIGEALSAHGNANILVTAPAALSGGATVGIALEAGTLNETIRVELRPGVGSAVS